MFHKVFETSPSVGDHAPTLLSPLQPRVKPNVSPQNRIDAKETDEKKARTLQMGRREFASPTQIRLLPTQIAEEKLALKNTINEGENEMEERRRQKALDNS